MTNFWSDEHKARLVDLIRDTQTRPYSEIAAIMNQEFHTTRFNRNTISGQVMRMRLSTRGHHFQTVFHDKKTAENPYRPKPEKPYKGGVKMIDLEPEHCRYPIGDPAKPGFVFCGRKRAEGPYCCRHAKVAFVDARPLKVQARFTQNPQQSEQDDEDHGDFPDRLRKSGNKGDTVANDAKDA